MNAENEKNSYNLESRKSRRRKHGRTKHSLIKEQTESTFKGNESRLRVNEDRERMVFNPGSSLKSSSKDLPRYYRSTLLYSFAFFALAYCIVYLPGKITSAFLASMSSRGPVIFHHKILFTNVVGWERGDALTIFSAPMVVDFFQSILYTSVFLGLKRLEGYWKIFAFWLMFHSYLRWVGCILPGMLSGEEFGYVAGWLYMNSMVLFVLFFVSVLIIIGLSALLCKWALETAFSKHMVMKKKRQEYLFFFIGLPALCGIIFVGFLHSVDWNELANGHLRWADWWDSIHELTLLSQSLMIYGAIASFVLLYREQEILCQRDLSMQDVHFPVLGLALMVPWIMKSILSQGWYW